jgi:hypothetical protein
LPEIGEEILEVDAELEIRMMEGTSLRLNPQTGKISYPEYAGV